MRDKNKEEWDRVVRYCGMCKNSDTAQDLFKRERKGARLTAKQISSIEWFAGQMVDLVGEENEVVRGEIVRLPVPTGSAAPLTGRAVGW
jgi:hypothetical protein